MSTEEEIAMFCDSLKEQMLHAAREWRTCKWNVQGIIDGGLVPDEMEEVGRQITVEIYNR